MTDAPHSANEVPSTAKSPVVLLHLSDIHLDAQAAESTQDVDGDIRAKLLDDLRGGEVPQSTAVDAVVVTGDVAYRGDRSEYDSASAWLKVLCAAVNCNPSSVWTVPGNHDVQQAVAKNSVTLRDLHSSIYEAGEPSRALLERLRDRQAAETMLSPFDAYNAFARQYGCETLPTRVSWSSGDDGPALDKALELNDGSELRLIGLNSALISSAEDGGRGKPCQVLGLKQVQLPEEPGVSNLTLCHHPIDWLLDHDDVEDYLVERARVQLFGHKHRARARKIENSLVVGAGALHPNRQEAGWQPRYNIIHLQVTRAGERRRLQVDVFERAWSGERTRFAGAGEPKCVHLELPAWEPSGTPARIETTGEVPTPEPGSANSADAAAMSQREVVYEFFDLSYPHRMQVLVAASLLENEDSSLSASELIRRVMQRVEERGELEEFARLIREKKKEEEEEEK